MFTDVRTTAEIADLLLHSAGYSDDAPVPPESCSSMSGAVT
jgi:hypothetical protein